MRKKMRDEMIKNIFPNRNLHPLMYKNYFINRLKKKKMPWDSNHFVFV